MSKKGVILVVVLATVIGTVGALVYSGVLSVGEGTKTIKNMETYEEYARVMVERCADAPYRPTCYEEEVPTLTSELTSPEIFDVIRLIRKYDPEYLFCHVLAHELGVYEVSLDPDNWLDVIAMAPPDNLCSNGFSHGAIVARFNDEVLTPEELDVVLEDLAIACEPRDDWDPTDLIKAICYHGIGHVLIHMTEADVDLSVKACEVVALKDDGSDYRTLCEEGVYMQLFQPLEPEDYALIDQLPEAPTKENLPQWCAENSNTDGQYGACWREAWPLFYRDLFTPEAVINYCSQLSLAQGQEDCYVTVFTIHARHNLDKPDKMADMCNNVPTEYQGMCLGRGANAYPEENHELIPNAIDMCSRGATEAARDECYAFLARTAPFNFHAGSDAHELMCSSLPSEHQARCYRTRH